MGKKNIGEGDVAACMNDVEDIVTNAEDLYSMAKSRNFDINKALGDVKTIVSDVQSAKSDCKLGLDDAPIEDFQKCFEDISHVVTAVEDIYSQLISGQPDFTKLLQDAEEVEEGVKAAEADCKQSGFGSALQVAGFQDCVSDVEGVAVAAEDIFKQIKNGSPNFSQIIADAQTIASDVTAAKADCHLSQVKIPVYITYLGDSTCEEDL